MIDKPEEEKYMNQLIQDLIKPIESPIRESLKDIFNRRLIELQMSKTAAANLLEIESRTLNGILDGTLQRVDISNLVKVSNFLQISLQEIFILFSQSLEKNFPQLSKSTSKSILFINQNFDVAALKKVGFIDSVSDYEQIEKKIVDFFGLRNIFEYKLPPMNVAFSSGVVKPKNNLSRDFWINVGMKTFYKINNPYSYQREALIKYFPEIRWHCTNVNVGLIEVMQSLYRMGITVIYQSRMKTDFHLRGATFSIDNKPCILLTDYRGFYPTLWFALIHELFHVLFDWDEIKKNKYHVSGELEQLSVQAKEEEADNFAREYLFSKEKSNIIRPHLKDVEYVKKFSKVNNVDSSFVYVFNAKDLNTSSAWALAQKYNQNFSKLLNELADPIKPDYEINRKIYN